MVDIRIPDDASDDEIRAIGKAVSRHFDRNVTIVTESGETVEAVPESDGRADPAATGEFEPTEREQVLRDEIADILEGGPEKYKAQLPEENKLFVRDRLELWFDGLEFEDGRFAAHDADDRLPADGLITGAAQFEGRDLHVMANDYTVKRGSMAAKGVEKFLRMQQRALDTGRPIIYLMDSSGGRIDQQTGFFANREGIGKFYYNHSKLSGRVPQICVLYGPCIAGAAYTPVFADFTIMVRGMSSMAIASPRMVGMVTGEDVDLQSLGGPEVHARHSGSADLVAEDEEHARALVARLISYLPDNCEEKPQRLDGRAPKRHPAGLDHIIPEAENKPYDMDEVIAHIVDDESVLELRPEYGPEILTSFARIEGRAIGIVANRPNQRAGAIFPDAAEKAAQFIWTCDAYTIPLLYLCDTPGFMVGTQMEKDGILEQGKRMIYATSSATVPKVSVIVRKAYGAGIYAMGGPAYDPESTIALPSGEIAIMGPEAAINAVYANKLAAIEDPEERARHEAELREEYRQDIDVRRMASEAVIDEIVLPSELRAELDARFSFYETVEKDLPEKKHGTVI